MALASRTRVARTRFFIMRSPLVGFVLHPQGGSCHRFCRIYRISVVSVRLSPSLSFQLSVNLSPFLPPLNLNPRYWSRETAGPPWRAEEGRGGTEGGSTGR